MFCYGAEAIVNPGSSFEQTMMGRSPVYYTASFVEIGPLVPEKNILKRIYHSWVWGPSWSCDTDAAEKHSFPQPMELHSNFGFALIDQVVLEKISEH